MNIELFTNKEIIHYTSLDEVQQEKEIDLIAVILMCKSFMDDSLEKDRFNDLELRLHLDIEESNRITESYASAKEAELEAEAKKRRERITIEEFESIRWSPCGGRRVVRICRENHPSRALFEHSGTV